MEDDGVDESGFPEATGPDVASRLVDLVYLLSRCGPVSLAEISRDFAEEGQYQGSSDAARRMLHRDRQRLRALGIDVGEEDDRYSIEVQNVQPRRPLTPEERAAVALACRRVLPTVAPDVRRTLLSGLVKLDALDLLEDDLADTRSVAPAVLVPVADACRRRRPLAIGYTNAAGDRSSRTIHPWSIRATEGQWYVRAWDEQSAAPRTFKLSRMDPDPKLTGGSFRAPEPGTDLGAELAASPFEWGDAEPHVVTLVLDGEHTGRLLPPGATVTEDETGRILATIRVRDDEAFASVVLRLGTAVEVIEPATTRRSLRRRLQAILDDLDAPAGPLPDLDAAEPTAARDAARDRHVVRAERLLRLIGIALAQGRGAWDRDELCRVLQVSESELARDLGLLMYHCGLPPLMAGEVIDVFVDETEVTVFPMVDLPLVSQLTNWEAAALMIAIRTAAAAGGPGTDVLTSALGALGMEAPQVEVALPPLPPEPVRGTVAAELAEALHDGMSCEIEYLKAQDGSLSWRRLDPWRLYGDKGRMYVAGWDLDADGVRNFRVDRIQAVKVSGDPITHEPALDLAPDLSPLRGPEDVRVAVELAGDHVDWATSRYGSVVEAGCRHFLLLWSGNLDRLAPTLLSLEPACRVVDPPAARDAVRLLAAELAERYT